LTKVESTSTATDVGTSMINFIKDFTSKIDNDLIKEMTEKLSVLSQEVSNNNEETNEDSVNSEND
jgi:hypothetical protein